MAFKRDKDGLTVKERRFIEAYLQHGNGSQAAREAGFDIGKYGGGSTKAKEQKIASALGEQYLNKPHIKTYMAKIMLRRKISPEAILSRIDQLADNAERDSDKLRALELLGKHVKLFTDAIESDKPTNIILKLGKFNGLQVIQSEVIEAEEVTDQVKPPSNQVKE